MPIDNDAPVTPPPLIEQLKLVARAYMEATGLSSSKLSARIFVDGGKLPKILEHGAGITVDRHDKAMQWFSDNWPAEAEWPEGVLRKPTAVAA